MHRSTADVARMTRRVAIGSARGAHYGMVRAGLWYARQRTYYPRHRRESEFVRRRQRPSCASPTRAPPGTAAPLIVPWCRSITGIADRPLRHSRAMVGGGFSGRRLHSEPRAVIRHGRNRGGGRRGAMFVADLASLIEAEIPHLRRYARALIGHSDEADDLVQTCLERAHSHSHQWNPARGLRPWLFRIQHNLYVSWLRRRDREYSYYRRYPESGSVEANHDATIELSAVQDALDLLPGDQRTVILLIALEGPSYEEASEVLGVPVGTVRSRLSRGRESLRAKLYPGDKAGTGRAQGGGK